MPLNRMKQGREHGTLSLKTYKGSPIKIKEMVRQVNCFGLCDQDFCRDGSYKFWGQRIQVQMPPSFSSFATVPSLMTSLDLHSNVVKWDYKTLQCWRLAVMRQMKPQEQCLAHGQNSANDGIRCCYIWPFSRLVPNALGQLTLGSS